MAAPDSPDAHILIVDDDERIRTLLQKYLVKNGFWVTPARDAAHARALLKGLEFDLLVFDVMLPGEDGFSLTSDLRRTINTPILLLTARGGPNDRILGLEAGADDYLAKPFEPRELVLRINAILRRALRSDAAPEPPKTLQLGEVRYDLARGELWRGSKPVRLTATETILMRVFSARPGQAVTRSELAEATGEGKSQDRAIDVQITRLRRKIEADAKTPRYLQTVRGTGYMLAPD